MGARKKVGNQAKSDCTQSNTVSCSRARALLLCFAEAVPFSGKPRGFHFRGRQNQLPFVKLSPFPHFPKKVIFPRNSNLGSPHRNVESTSPKWKDDNGFFNNSLALSFATPIDSLSAVRERESGRGGREGPLDKRSKLGRTDGDSNFSPYYFFSHGIIFPRAIIRTPPRISPPPSFSPRSVSSLNGTPPPEKEEEEEKLKRWKSETVFRSGTTTSSLRSLFS